MIRKTQEQADQQLTLVEAIREARLRTLNNIFYSLCFKYTFFKGRTLMYTKILYLPYFPLKKRSEQNNSQ